MTLRFGEEGAGQGRPGRLDARQLQSSLVLQATVSCSTGRLSMLELIILRMEYIRQPLLDFSRRSDMLT